MLKSRISYGLFLFAAMAFYLFYSKFIAFVVLFIVVAVPVFMVIPVTISLNKLKIKFNSDVLMTENGDETEFGISVDNPSAIGLRNVRIVVETRGIYSLEKIKQKYIFSIDKKSQKQILLRIKSDHCTKVTMQIKKAYCCEPLGVLSASKRLLNKLNIYVVPKLLGELSNVDASNLADDEGSRYSTYKKGEDYAQTFDYHIYHDGDKIKHINWKLSGKQDQLMVREGSFPLSSRACILVEPNMLKLQDTFDNMLLSAVRISDNLTASEVPHDICFFCESDECCRFVNVMDISDFYYAITLLYENSSASFTKSDNRILPELLSAVSSSTYAKIYYIANILTEETSDNLISLDKKSEVTVFVTENNNDYVDVLESYDIEINRI